MCAIFDGHYLICEDGEVYNSGRYYWEESQAPSLSVRIGTDGYPTVNLHLEGRIVTVTIHRQLAIAFVPNPESKPQVNHKNGNKLHYSLSNLEWSTQSENMIHAFENGLCKPPQPPIKVYDRCKQIEYPSIRAAARANNLSYSKCRKYLEGLIPNKTCLQYARQE